MNNNLFSRLLEAEKDFNLDSIKRNFWTRLIKLEQEAKNINFDLENNSPVGEPREVSLSINHPNGDPVTVLCQLYSAGGDWEDPVGYFRCEKDWYWLIVIPGSEVNKNLVKAKDGGYTAGTEDGETRIENPIKIKDIEEELWKALETELEERLSGEADPDVWEIDYKKARAYTGFPK